MPETTQRLRLSPETRERLTAAEDCCFALAAWLPMEVQCDPIAHNEARRALGQAFDRWLALMRAQADAPLPDDRAIGERAA